MKEHIFIIKYTNENGWEWDVDTEVSRFDDGTIYDTETQEWKPAHLGEGEYVDNDDEVSEQLSSMLQIANESMGKGMAL
jgi:hypothetical protein